MRFQGPSVIHGAFQASTRSIERPCLKTKILKPKSKSECIEQLMCGTQQMPRHTVINKHSLSTYCIPQTISVCNGKMEFLPCPHLLCCPSPLPYPVLNCRDHPHVTLAT